MELTKQERRLILNFETRLKYASSRQEVAWCRSQLQDIHRKVKDRMDKMVSIGYGSEENPYP